MKKNIFKLIDTLDGESSILHPTSYIVTEKFDETKKYNVKNLIAYIEFGALCLHDDDYVLLKNGCASSCFLIKDVIKPIKIVGSNISIYFKSGQVEIAKID